MYFYKVISKYFIFFLIVSIKSGINSNDRSKEIYKTEEIRHFLIEEM